MARAEVRRRRIGQLDCVEVVTDPQAPYVVLFHGFGADANDLAPLNQALSPGRPVNWVFPEGHLSVPLGGHYEGRAWFPISIAELEKTMAGGQPIDFTTLTPPGMKKARELATDCLEKLGVPMNRVILGGFSQGAMVATELTLRAEVAPAGLVILSGTLVNAESWQGLAAKRAGLPFFQSHGRHDPILPFHAAERLETVLVSGGLKGKLLAFEGQHEIPLEVLSQLSRFLRERLPQ